MDSTQFTHISLCSGYGGIDLGLRRVLPGLRTIAYAEIEEFACGLLASRMEAGQLDSAPIWTNLKTFPWAAFHGKVHILSGGYPCQPFSAAGKRLGAADPRHLWPFIADGIRAMRPELCFFENVEGHISLGLREVISELGSLGYRTTGGLFSASEVGAPHQRKRVFILAHRKGTRLEGYRRPITGEVRHDSWPSRPGQPQQGWEPPRVVGQIQLGDADSGRLERPSTEPGRAEDAVGSGGEDGKGTVVNPQSEQDDVGEPGQLGQAQREGGCVNDAAADSSDCLGNAAEPRLEICGGSAATMGQPRTQSESERSDEDSQCWQTEPPVGGNVDGSSGWVDYAQLCISGDNRTDELRLLGNGVVPATAERAFRTLIERLL